MTAVYLKVHEDHEDDENAGIEVRQQWLEDSKKLLELCIALLLELS
jgi:hypothetical protein